MQIHVLTVSAYLNDEVYDRVMCYYSRLEAEAKAIAVFVEMKPELAGRKLEMTFRKREWMADESPSWSLWIGDQQAGSYKECIYGAKIHPCKVSH